MRYGVLHDIGQLVFNEQPVNLAMGCANVIWQGDANAMSTCALTGVKSPPFVVNVAGPETISVRRAAEAFGAIFGKAPILSGVETPTALLSNGQLGHRLYGYPRVSVRQVIEWTADWIVRGGASLGRPTHFETRDGKF
jgi:hypothetical protein